MRDEADHHGEGLDAARPPGTAGASARAEYERRAARDDARRRSRFGRLALVVRVLAGPRPSTQAWARGAEGEALVGRRIERVVGADGVVLHDRRLKGSRRNLDHLVVVASGVWVIDAKHYHGRLARRQVGGWFTPRQILTVGRRDESRLLVSALQQRSAVEDVLNRDPSGTTSIPVHAALCFTGVELPLAARPFVMDGVLVTWPRVLPRALRAAGPLSGADRMEVAARLAGSFPPYRQPAAPSAPEAPGRPRSV